MFGLYTKQKKKWARQRGQPDGSSLALQDLTGYNDFNIDYLKLIIHCNRNISETLVLQALANSEGF